MNLNAQRTNNLNWFSASKLIDSSWQDMKSEPKNIFSIPGQHNRNFFINSRYGGCPNDVGWMVITSNYCKWETRFLPRKNVILYSKLSGHTNWNQYSKSTIYNGGVGEMCRVGLKEISPPSLPSLKVISFTPATH